MLQNATLPDGSTVNVRIDSGVVVAIEPASSPSNGSRADQTLSGDTLDLAGFLLLTAPAEPHAHLDKALSFDLINPPMGDLIKAITSWREYSSVMTEESIADRAREQALRMLSQGTTAVRAHVDMLAGADPLRGARALVQVRRELLGLMHIELVALAGPDVPDDVVEAALDLGVDLVGGAPHLAEDPFMDLNRLLAIAHRRGIGVDIHTDESLDGPLTIREFARVVKDWPASQPAAAGHCSRLGTLAQAELQLVIDEVLASDLAIVTLPITNLYLQGWEHPVATPRGLTAVRALLDRGVRLGAGADNVRDPFNPVGRSDALETASLLVTAGHVTLEEAWHLVSAGSRDVMSLPFAGVSVGAAAEFLAVRGRTLSDVVANASADRFVIHAGRLVAHSSVSYSVARSAQSYPVASATEATPLLTSLTPELIETT